MWIPAILRDCPCVLLMDVAKARRTGNCNLLTTKEKSVRIGGIRGMNTSLTFAQPVRILASTR